ncbi:MAG: LPS export ABC transporter permease LptF [Proteobacteria bacterium]|nr:LPS export ABC transporter permease LptF [Pseudomonadota bacterium]
MKLNSIINRYIFREMIPPFLINLGFLSFIFLLAQILEITNLVVNYKVSLGSVCLLVIYSMPEFLKFTIPMSVMMGVLLTFLKMASDKEIIAIKAGGCSIYHLMAPVFLFCLIGFAMTFGLSVYGLSWSKNAYKDLVAEMMSQSADAAIKERVFNDHLPGIVFYVNTVDVKNKMLLDVFIEDSRNEKNKSTVVAPRGKRFVTPENSDSFTLRLFDGMIIRVKPEDFSVNTIRFDTYDITIPIEKAKNKPVSTVKDQDEMSVSELKAYIRDAKISDELRNAAIMDLHEKFSIPFACFTLGLLAMPMGLKSAFSRKSSGLGLGLACFLAYYALMGLGWSGGKSSLFPPYFGMWMPNIIMGVFGLYMLLRVAKEKPIGLEFIPNYYRAFLLRFKNKKKASPDKKDLTP